MKWEYNVVALTYGIDNPDSRKSLKAQGEQGWELVQALPSATGGTVLVFKKPKPATD
jgi:hypothetical protein